MPVVAVTAQHQAEKRRGLLLQHVCLAGVLLFFRYLVVQGNLAQATVTQHPLSNCWVPPIWYSKKTRRKQKPILSSEITFHNQVHPFILSTFFAYAVRGISPGVFDPAIGKKKIDTLYHAWVCRPLQDCRKQYVNLCLRERALFF